MKIGVSNGKRGNTRTKRLRRQTQGSRLSVFCPKHVTLGELPTLERASKLHSQEDMVGVVAVVVVVVVVVVSLDMVGGCDVKEGRSKTATRTTSVSSFATLPEKRVGWLTCFLVFFATYTVYDIDSMS